MEPIRKTSGKYISAILLFGAFLISGCANEDTTSNGPIGGVNPITPTTSCPAGTICLGTGNGGNPLSLTNSILVATLNSVGDSALITTTGNIEFTDGRVVPPAGVTPNIALQTSTYPFGVPAGITMVYLAQNGSPVSGPIPVGDGVTIFKGRQGILSPPTPIEVRAYLNVYNPAAIKSGFRSLSVTLQAATQIKTETAIMEVNRDQPWLGVGRIHNQVGPYRVGDKLVITNTTLNPLQNVTTPHALHLPGPISVGVRDAGLGPINHLSITYGPSPHPLDPLRFWYRLFDGLNWGTLGASGDGVNYRPLIYDASMQEWKFTIPPTGFCPVGMTQCLVYLTVLAMRDWVDNAVSLGAAGANVTIE